MLCAKGVAKVKKALKKKGAMSSKELEEVVKNLRAKQPFQEETIAVTDPQKFLESILPYMIKQKMVTEEKEGRQVVYRLRK